MMTLGWCRVFVSSFIGSRVLRSWIEPAIETSALWNSLFRSQVSFAIIQSHVCNYNLSATFHEAGVLHFVASGTDLTLNSAEAEVYMNKHSWCGIFYAALITHLYWFRIFRLQTFVTLAEHFLNMILWMSYNMERTRSRLHIWHICINDRYLYLNSYEYPDLYLKHLNNIGASRIALLWKNDDRWTHASAR